MTLNRRRSCQHIGDFANSLLKGVILSKVEETDHANIHHPVPATLRTKHALQN
jgi:hypothetical protein